MPDHDELLIRLDETSKHTLAIVQNIEKRLDVHAGRIRTLEMWRNWLAGAVATVGAIVGIRSH